MTFLNPLFLFGLLAAGIPVVIHLLTRRRPRRIEFSSVEFLREVNVAQLRRFRLRELLLLALRVLAIALLALALARPALRGARGAGGRDAASAVVLLIDRSASMGAVENQEPLDRRARDRARTVLESLEPADEVQVVPFDARPEPLFPRATADHARAARALDAIAPRPFPTDLEGAIAQGVELLRRAPQVNRELFLVSDLQLAGLPAAGGRGGSGGGAAAAESAAASGLPVAAQPRPENLAVTGARVRQIGRVAGAGLTGADAAAPPAGPRAGGLAVADYVPAQAGPAGAAAGGGAAEVTVRSFGSPGGDVAVGVRDAAGAELGRAFVPLGAGEGSALVPLARVPADGGEAYLPEDALAVDNRRWFASGPRGRTQVGLVEGGTSAASPLALALAAGEEAGEVEFRRVEAAGLSPGALAGLDVLVLNDVPDLAEGALSAVVDYARGGGAVAIVLGPRARPDFYGGRLLPALGSLRLGAPRDAGGGRWSLRLATPGHPAFEGFPARAGEPLTQAEFRRAWTLLPGDTTRVLARFAADLPALVEEPRLLVFASDIDGQWNDFPSRGAFLPLWLQALRALARGAATLDLRPGQRFALPVPVGQVATDVRLAGPDGRDVPLTPSLADGARRLVSPPLDELGLYRVTVGARPLRDVAVNLDPRESDLARLTPAEARRRWAAYRPVVLEGGADLARRIREGRFGREIAGDLLLAALLVLVLETVIGRLMTPAPGTAPAGVRGGGGRA